MELGVENADSCDGGIYDFGFQFINDLGQSAGVIRLRMVGNDDFNLRRVDDGCDSGIHFLFERSLYGVDQGRFFAEHEIGVVCSSAMGMIPVEFLEIPVDCADPPDFIGDFYSFEWHGSESCFCWWSP